MPPGVDRGDVLASLASRAKRQDWSGAYPDLDRATRIPLAEVQDVAGLDDDRFVCVAKPGTELDVLRDQLADVHGIWAVIPASLPQPLPAMVRRWVLAHAGEDLLASLARLEDAVARQSNAPCSGR